MTADQIRQKFLDFFAERGHEARPSASLVPVDDPTLLFVNAGMVPFKQAFLGQEEPAAPRVTTVQKCVRAGGKHNDLEEVGRTARHHTFFEMLGNFSFGDYFKREAIEYAWDFLTETLDIPKDRLWITVHRGDDEAAELWLEGAGVPTERIFRLGDADNFWQMADTGPCGPSSEIHYDMREDRSRLPTSAGEFEALAHSGEMLEVWNLVFMQFDRDAHGTLHPLPAPSIDTGAGLERLTAVIQGVRSNYQTDLFTGLIDRAVEVVGKPYAYESSEGVSYRVLADHARATAFLLADGVFPSNEGRGYVLRRILRRGVRHAWLLDRREPTLAPLVDVVVDAMGSDYPELEARRNHLHRTTRAEEERFLATIDEGMERFDQIAPAGGSGTVSGKDAFRLYDTYGFPFDLTELMAEERGYEVDTPGFEAALEEQRERSRRDRAESGLVEDADWTEGWEELSDDEQRIVFYDRNEVRTEVVAVKRGDDRLSLVLSDHPFYAESGGQVSDRGVVEGDGWRLDVEEVRRVGDRVAVSGPVSGSFEPGEVMARVDPARRDTERHHTATHLLHAALRERLGTHVHQQGSLVAPNRLRFDFAHNAPLTDEEITAIEDRVNAWIRDNAPVTASQMGYREALDRGAMALFSEKYGDEVRVIEVADVSMELCGGTHVRSTGQIALFRIVSESGVAAGVRRIEAVTGAEAYRRMREDQERLRAAAELLRSRVENVPSRVEALLEEQRALTSDLRRAREEGSRDVVGELLGSAGEEEGVRTVAAEVKVADAEELRAMGDRLRERLGLGVGVLSADLGEKRALLAVASDEAISRGIRADALVREVAALAGGRGGGKAHMAQAGVGDAERIPDALRQVPDIVRKLAAGAAA